jgi:predicted DNA-binding transcriptional regulator AlpA
MSSSKPGRFGGGRVGFYEHEIDDWIRRRIRVKDGQPALPPATVPAKPTIIPVKEVERRIGVSRVCIWRWEQQGTFPSRIRLDDPGVGVPASAA